MNKQVRQLELLLELMNERDQIEENIKALPVGYISVKQISGHTYYYRQWREGKKIISQYVPDALLSSVKRKIAVRKENEKPLNAQEYFYDEAYRLIEEKKLKQETMKKNREKSSQKKTERKKSVKD